MSIEIPVQAEIEKDYSPLLEEEEQELPEDSENLDEEEDFEEDGEVINDHLDGL